MCTENFKADFAFILLNQDQVFKTRKVLLTFVYGNFITYKANNVLPFIFQTTIYLNTYIKYKYLKSI